MKKSSDYVKRVSHAADMQVKHEKNSFFDKNLKLAFVSLGLLILSFQLDWFVLCTISIAGICFAGFVLYCNNIEIQTKALNVTRRYYINDLAENVTFHPGKI